MGCNSPSPGSSLTQGLNPGLLHCKEALGGHFRSGHVRHGDSRLVWVRQREGALEMSSEGAQGHVKVGGGLAATTPPKSSSLSARGHSALFFPAAQLTPQKLNFL